MLRPFAQSGSFVWLCLVWAAPMPMAAQTPFNSLRAGARSQSPTPADPRMRWPDTDAAPMSAEDYVTPDYSSVGETWAGATEMQNQLRSVVPPQLGQPPGLSHQPYGELGPEDYPPDASGDWSGPVVHPWFAQPWFSHSDPNDPLRHIGLGQPLVGTSWRNRPLYAGLFMGGVILDDLVSNHVDQSDTAFMGLRLGHDFDHYWGLELRYAFARPNLQSGAGVPLPDHGRDYFVDVELVHYPWGDAYFRPYFLAGLGFQTFRFHDDHDHRFGESLLSIPLGVGLKYFAGPWISLRFDFVDNIAVGNDRVSGMHNFALMGGVEYRFGGRRPSYFPWHTNTAYW
jgi:hypothetical protein